MEAKILVGTNGKHTSNYRLSHDGSGVMSKEAFVGNNDYMRYKFGTVSFPWLQKQIFKY
jgi:hypothetical protein